MLLLLSMPRHVVGCGVLCCNGVLAWESKWIGLYKRVSSYLRFDVKKINKKIEIKIKKCSTKTLGLHLFTKILCLIKVRGLVEEEGV